MDGVMKMLIISKRYKCYWNQYKQSCENSQ